MNRLLETSHFKNSRRYPALFRFIVEETLEGRGEFLKERLLGVHVFNRPPDYDTADDPIVRVTIAEIRKRIAQYYHDEAHETEMRIELLPGNYEPEFHPSRVRGGGREALANPAPGGSNGVISLEGDAVLANATASPTEKKEHSHLSWLKRYGLMAAAFLIVVGASVAIWRWTRPSVIAEFWKPITVSRHAVIFCLPADAARSQAAQLAGIISSTAGSTPHLDSPASQGDSPTFLDHETEGENVVFSDVLAMQKISNWLASQGTDSVLRLNVLTTLDDLQQGPTVLIGGLDNNWTLRGAQPAALPLLRHQPTAILDCRQQESKQERLVRRSRETLLGRSAGLRSRCPLSRRINETSPGCGCGHRHERDCVGREVVG